MIISDSILISLESDQSSDTYKSDLGVFLLYCSVLTKELFVFGLPLRGCIEYGEFYTAKNTFAGKPIIKAYKLGSNIEMSGCLISESVKIEKITAVVKNRLYYEYLVPTKTGEEKSILLTFLMELDDDESEMCSNNPRQFVVNSFAAHNKHISPLVYKKIDNTEMFIRYCVSKRMEIEK